MGLVHEASYHGVPWLLIPLAVGAIGWLAGVSEAVQRWRMAAAVFLAVAGYSLVFWEFFVVPVRNDIKRARGKSNDQLD